MKASYITRIISFIIAIVVFFKCDLQISGLIIGAIASFNYGIIKAEKQKNAA